MTGLPMKKMTVLSRYPVDRFGGGPYNPPIAEDRGAARFQRLKQTLESTGLFGVFEFRFPGVLEVENRVLTDGNVSNITRHADDAERVSLPLFSVL